MIASALAMLAVGARRWWVALAVLGLALGGVSVAGASGVRSERVGHAAVVPRGATVLGALGAQTVLHVTLALEPRDPSGLAAYASAVATPGDPDYHQFLSVQQFAARFGASRATSDAVVASLRSHGLNPEPVSANGLSVSVAGTAAQIERAFSIGLDSYAVSGQRRYSATAAPLIASSIAGDVQSVDGLSSLAEPTAQPGVVTGGPQPTGSSCPAEATDGTPDGDNYYFPDQLATQYDLNGFYETGDEGAGQTVALIEFEPYTQSDIDAYAQCLGVSDANVSEHDVDGGVAGTSQSGEAALDIEDILGLAPKADIKVYEAPGSDEVDEYNAVISSGAQVISTSWGLCEPQNEKYNAGLMQTENTDFEEAATQGQTVLAAAGDSGSSDCIRSDDSQALAVDDPASQPFVTGVGGTSLGDLGTPGPETIWDQYDASNSSDDAGGAGGYSNFWDEPSYQSGVAVSPNNPPTDCTNSYTTVGGTSAESGCREVPDVSADADPDTGYAIYFEGGWTVYGGTSAAAPLWAAYIALANDSSGTYCAAGSKQLGFLNPALYAAAGNSATYARDFNDVVSGANATNGTVQGAYAAGAGYDMASGLGTPDGTLLAGTLCGDSLAITKIANQTTSTTGTVNFKVSATGSGNTYSSFSLPAGISLSSTTGTFSGTPTTVGTYYPTVVVTHGSATTEQTFTWTVTNVPVHFTSSTITSQKWIVTDAVTSITATATDGEGGQITYGEVGLPSGLSINSSTGVISGTPEFIGSGTALIKASSAATGTTPGQEQFTWTSAPTTVNVASVTNRTWGVGVPVSLQLSASDSGTNRTVSFSGATGLPSGLSISSSGLISGTPTVDQASTPVTVIAADDYGSRGTTTFSFVVNGAVSLTSAAISAQSWIVTDPISKITVTASDNSPGGKITYSASGLPAGVSINASSGAMNGTPTAVGSGTATITASSSNANSSPAQEQFSWTVAATTVSVTAVPSQSWTVGTAVSLQISATDTSPSQTLTYSASGLPAGLSISSTTGLISGTPSGAQNSGSASVTVADGTGSQTTVTFGVVVSAAPVSGSSDGGSSPSTNDSTAPSQPTPSSMGTTSTSASSPTPSPTGSTGSNPITTVSKPSASASARGTSTRRPVFVVKVTAAKSTRLSKIVIHLPKGFSASRTAKKIKAGITVSLKGAKVTVSGSAVTITLSGASATITFSSADLSIAKSLASQVKKHKAKAESFNVSVKDSGGIATLKLSLTPR